MPSPPLGDPEDSDFADPSGSPSPPAVEVETSPEAEVGIDLPATLPEFASLLAFAKKFGQSVVQGTGVASGFQTTKASVVNSFMNWSKPLEGLTNYLYTDAEGLVTVGLGNLLDSLAAGQQMHSNCGHGTSTPCGQSTPTAAARALPWTGGSIDADWAAIKAAWPGKQSTACAGITSARLSSDAIQSLIAKRMKSNEADLIRLLPGYAQAPADAQLAAMSMSWAMGSGFPPKFPSFTKAFAAGDYAGAAAQSHMQGVGIDMRNLANKLLLLNAAAVKAAGLNPDHLYYVDAVGSGVASAAIAPLRFALRAMPKVDSGLLLDAGIVLGCTLLGSAGGVPGAVIGFVVGVSIDAFRRLQLRR